MLEESSWELWWPGSRCWRWGWRGANSWKETPGVWISWPILYCTILPGLKLLLSWSWSVCCWHSKWLFCRKYYYLFNSLWLTLQTFLGRCYKKRWQTKITFYNNGILPAGNLDLWYMREFPKLAKLDEKISSEIHDSLRTGPTVLLLWCQGTVMPALLCSFISGAKRCVYEKEALRLTEKLFLCQARMLLLQKTLWMHGSVYTPLSLFFPFCTGMPKI